MLESRMLEREESSTRIGPLFSSAGSGKGGGVFSEARKVPRLPRVLQVPWVARRAFKIPNMV